MYKNWSQYIDTMTDADFPSGRWTGFFMQPLTPGRHRMRLDLDFDEGQLQGRGSDWVGSFTIHGEYDRDTGDCRFTKKYVGRHSVTYAGRNEGQGIWGVWELSQLFGLISGRGVFHIWPVGMTPTREADLTELAMQGGQLRSWPLFVALAIVAALTLLGAFAYAFFARGDL